MGGKKFWLPVICFLAATPVCLLLGLASAGVGHGDYVIARILFPSPMLAAVLFGSVGAPLVVLSVAQFPLYGIALGAANVRGKMPLASVVLLAAHALSAAACFVVPGEIFS